MQPHFVYLTSYVVVVVGVGTLKHLGFPGVVMFCHADTVGEIVLHCIIAGPEQLGNGPIVVTHNFIVGAFGAQHGPLIETDIWRTVTGSTFGNALSHGPFTTS